MDIGSQEFIEELKLFQGAVIDHAEREELEEFSRLQRELRRRGPQAEWRRPSMAAEAIAPTRPHAGVESAKANFALGPFASMLDRARDVIKQAVQ